jgi:hypothetical protein
MSHGGKEQGPPSVVVERTKDSAAGMSWTMANAITLIVIPLFAALNIETHTQPAIPVDSHSH